MEAASKMVYIRNFNNDDDENDNNEDECEVSSDELNNSFDSDEEEEQDFMFMKDLNIEQDKVVEQSNLFSFDLHNASKSPRLMSQDREKDHLNMQSDIDQNILGEPEISKSIFIPPPIPQQNLPPMSHEICDSQMTFGLYKPQSIGEYFSQAPMMPQIPKKPQVEKLKKQAKVR